MADRNETLSHTNHPDAEELAVFGDLLGVLEHLSPKQILDATEAMGEPLWPGEQDVEVGGLAPFRSQFGLDAKPDDQAKINEAVETSRRELEKGLGELRNRIG